MMILPELLSALKSACAGFPDKRRGGDFIFTCKPPSHKTLYDFIIGAETCQLTVKDTAGAKRQTRRYRWFNAVPLRDGPDAMTVDFLEIAIRDAKGKTVYKGAFDTSLAITKTNAEAIWIAARKAKGSRTRFFEHIRTLSAYIVFPSWDIFLETLIASKPPPQLQNQSQA